MWAYVETPTGQQFGFGLLSLGYDDRVIYLESAPTKFLLIVKFTGSSAEFDDQSQLDDQLRKIGSRPSSLRPPDTAYQSPQWSPLDLVAVPLVLSIPAILVSSVLPASGGFARMLHCNATVPLMAPNDAVTLPV
jgi:hypothetical protein